MGTPYFTQIAGSKFRRFQDFGAAKILVRRIRAGPPEAGVDQTFSFFSNSSTRAARAAIFSKVGFSTLV